MHRITFHGYLKSGLLQAQARNHYCTHLSEHKRKRTKLFLKAHHFRSISGCVLILLPASARQSSSLYCNRKHLLLSREFHRNCRLQVEISQDGNRKEAKILPDLEKSAAQGSQATATNKHEKRKKMDFTKTYTERNFITPLRAMSEYLLKPSDLESLRKIQRRSPYEDTPPINVYLRRDVEAKAIEVWGSQEALQRELKKRQEEEQKYRDNVFHVKKVLKEFRSNMRAEEQKRQEMILRTSGRVVMTAVIINGTNFALKFVAWLYTGSHSMFAEATHSFADTCNQLLLAYGIKKSLQTPTQDHPYGYHSMRYVASLISGVGIFFFGTGLSLYHGVIGILNPTVIDSLLWGYVILCGSLISEGGTLIMAYRETKNGAKRLGMSFKEYVLRSQDPSVNVILLEDIAAVLSIGIAGTCMGLTSYTGLPIYDAVGSLLVGGVLGTVASFIIYTNSGALVGRAIPEERTLQINKEMENDVMIRAIHDVKATDMGNNYVRYKAEVDFDGRELTRSYLDSQDLDALLEEMQKLKSIEEVEAFMLKHGENIVDLLGGEVDRIENILKKRHPEIRHVDLEVL